MSGIAVPPDPSQLGDFPSTMWTVQQPLWRIHKEKYPTVHFAVDAGGRFNPASPDAGFGTWYLSTHPAGAFVEVFGRQRFVTRAQVDERVLAEVWLDSDVNLADLTNGAVLGRFGITNELSTGGDSIYPTAQAWAEALWKAGFAGILYASRFDVTLSTRSVALFGKSNPSVEDRSYVRPLDEVADDIVNQYQWPAITSGVSL